MSSIILGSVVLFASCMTHRPTVFTAALSFEDAYDFYGSCRDEQQQQSVINDNNNILVLIATTSSMINVLHPKALACYDSSVLIERILWYSRSKLPGLYY